jgi:hypothetical protein
MTATDDDDGWHRFDQAADGEALPPDGDLRGPAVDPLPLCPVVPIGMRDGVCVFLDYRSERRELTPRALSSKAELLTLCGGRDEWLWTCFPRRATRRIGNDLRSIVVGWSALAACAWLVKQCADQPMFGPHIVIRKPGVWQGNDGAPIVHCGDVLFIDGRFIPAGLRDGNTIWPAEPAVDRPANPSDCSTGQYVQAQLQDYWRFRHGGGAIVVLGTVASAMLGAWPRWRPSLFIGGDIGGGKSYLLDTLRAMCPLHYYTTDTTKAGLESNLAGRAMPSFVDEASDQVDQRGAQNLLTLITAATGGEGSKVARGTGDGKGRTTQVVGAVIMASIAPPDMQPQHLARIGLVELQAPDAGDDHRAEMDALIAFCREQAAAIWGRILAGHKRYVLALSAFRASLARIGCPPRQMDQHGAILAGHWVLCHDDVPDDREALNHVAAVRDFVLDAGEVAEQSAGRRVAEYLARAKLRKVQSIEEFPVAELALRAWQTSYDIETGDRIDSADADHHRDILARNGFRAVREDETADRNHRDIPRGGTGDGLWIAYHAPEVVKIFANTDWPGQRWRHLLRSLPGVALATRKVRVGASNTPAAIWLPRAILLSED